MNTAQIRASIKAKMTAVAASEAAADFARVAALLKRAKTSSERKALRQSLATAEARVVSTAADARCAAAVLATFAD